ncbi:MAG: YceI family protein [Alcaligenaceae bacterium]|jgi:polyisoprenoid-binding protein YceI|nr:YceI family protein [Alcaligenaceae bacterium]
MKNTLLRPLALVAALSLGTFTSAQAVEYTTLEPEASSIVFSYSQMNVKMDGDFSELKATELSFDPANPESAKVTIEVALSSIETGSTDANTELAKGEWLAIEQHPIATFSSSNVEALGDNNYQITGDLSIKGHTQTVTAPFSFTDNGDTGIFSGSFTFQRGDYKIGEGAWSSFGIVANDVEIKFDIIAKQ